MTYEYYNGACFLLNFSHQMKPKNEFQIIWIFKIKKVVQECYISYQMFVYDEFNLKMEYSIKFVHDFFKNLPCFIGIVIVKGKCFYTYIKVMCSACASLIIAINLCFKSIVYVQK